MRADASFAVPVKLWALLCVFAGVTIGGNVLLTCILTGGALLYLVLQRNFRLAASYGCFYLLLALLPVLEKHRVLGHVYTLFFVTLGFVLFDADSAAQAVSRISAMLGAGGLPLSSAQAVYYLKSYGPLLVLGILCATPLPKMIVAKLRKSKGAATALDVLEPLCVLIPLLLGTAFLVDGSFNPFLYFRF